MSPLPTAGEARLLVPVRHHPAALPVVLGEAADRGQRRAQLVAGVRDEPPHPLLGLVRRRLRFLPVVEGGLDLAQHPVQRPAQAADLGPRVALGHPPAEVPVGDLARGLLDVDQRPQVGPHHGHDDHGQDEHDEQAHDQLGQGEPADHRVDVAEVDADDQRPLDLLGARIRGQLIGSRPGDHPPRVVAGLGRYGDQLSVVGAGPGLRGGYGRQRLGGTVAAPAADAGLPAGDAERGSRPLDPGLDVRAPHAVEHPELRGIPLGGDDAVADDAVVGHLQLAVVLRGQVGAQDPPAADADGHERHGHEREQRRDQLGPQRGPVGKLAQRLPGPPGPPGPTAARRRFLRCHGRMRRLKTRAAAARTPRRAGYGSAWAPWCPPCAAARTRRTRRCRCPRGSRSPRRGRGSASWTAPGWRCS